MPIKQFEIWIADLNPQIGTEPGKTRPVLVLQKFAQQDSSPFNNYLSNYNQRNYGIKDFKSASKKRDCKST